MEYTLIEVHFQLQLQKLHVKTVPLN